MLVIYRNEPLTKILRSVASLGQELLGKEKEEEIGTGAFGEEGERERGGERDHSIKLMDLYP